MRVVHIIKVTRISGAERHLLILLRGLRGRGVDARLIMLVEPDKPMKDMAAAAQEHGIPLTRLSIRGDYDARLLWRLRRALRATAPDIAHTHLIHADMYGYAAAKLALVDTVISSRHNDDPFRYRPRWRRLNRQLWQRLDAGIAISGAMANFATEIEGAPRDKLRIVRYGMDYHWLSDETIQRVRHGLRAELGLPLDTPLLGMVCRLVRQKGVPYSLEALRRIQSDFPQARLVIIGDGEKAGELRQLATALGVAERVHWLSWRDDAAELMTALDVLLVPSLWEGFGLVVLEAMARRVPVIASRVSALPEVVVHGETGLLIEARDVDGLAQAIAQLLSDRALRKYMGLLGTARLEEHFSAARMVTETVEVYESVLAKRRPR
ncbi:MAG: glycosyltransferase family 4 protein [Chloroflexi bacterium]|nr:glycosyltransferase family 4 protein [Chloroflexota bacterium]MCY4248639.1 glycosyltransferase family 4 protein [Chloroflexota bacterium]